MTDTATLTPEAVQASEKLEELEDRVRAGDRSVTPTALAKARADAEHAALIDHGAVLAAEAEREAQRAAAVQAIYDDLTGGDIACLAADIEEAYSEVITAVGTLVDLAERYVERVRHAPKRLHAAGGAVTGIDIELTTRGKPGTLTAVRVDGVKVATWPDLPGRLVGRAAQEGLRGSRRSDTRTAAAAALNASRGDGPIADILRVKALGNRSNAADRRAG